jgi:hypothetical protein
MVYNLFKNLNVDRKKLTRPSFRNSLEIWHKFFDPNFS